MELEQIKVRSYLAKCSPLKDLPAEWLDRLAEAVSFKCHVSGDDVMKVGEQNNQVLLVRRGAVDVFLPDGELYGRFGKGDWVGYRSVMRGGVVGMNVKALEDCLFFAVPGALFLELVDSFERVSQYFSERKPERLRSAIKEMRGSDDYAMITLHVRDLMKPPLLLGRNEPVQSVAQQMMAGKSRTAIITGDDASLLGMVSDTDFRRVVAEGLSVAQPIGDIMTRKLYTLSASDQASEALLLMARFNLRHVPVVIGSEVVGVISATDLLRGQSQNAIYMVGDIFTAPDVARLAELSKGLPRVLVGLVKHNLPANDIGHAITSIGQAIVRRLLVMAEEQFGKPPVPYAFIVAGSMARREQTAHSDQDNGMILSDEYNEAEHGEYFRNVAKFVSDGLNDCGYVYCPGNVMATNDQWRQPLSVWRGYFETWINKPEPMALMYASIFFDLRCLHGDESLLDSLQEEVLLKTRASTLFQAFMAGNALSHKPPVGFFRGFVLDKDSKDDKADKGMDMKKRGVVPVIDMARLYALASGLKPINTWERLDAIAEAGGISRSLIDDLRDAFEFISTVRLQHQAQQIEKGQKPNNYVPPEELSALERRHLKDAFEVVSTMQDTMTTRYQANQFR
ncbi:MAG TPA: putative nucleotidyltransferase substrate binding domain-containing protein [Candidatus Thiothrix moscowensis]|uniref:putative nucleotidyltransferase substrate binding domain-containing protein n=1 Tax=unclassified Thiothrix TaxID=2636184 RepID=UPI0025DA2983|nr:MULTISPECIES: putative nucleotidyltransferase substrate binding domain-containing protein [unclassified Thiothrix]HRJ54092.1 putative nucleotidyltransferase substrate binding domain-containing protein [Candidatus Thiothrix moscowensis]HRJ94238.1 putative nucleotidyltransferase substrate binding domain-containing protein [Candidatus Thiothrix moscowensis]